MPNINIKLRSASNLTPKNIGGTSDPIVTCTVNNKKSFKTEPIMADCNPNWEAKKIKSDFIVNFDQLSDVMILQVDDYNIFSKNKPIGSCQIPLPVLEKAKPVEFTFDLRDKGGNIAGRLVTILEAVDFGIVQSTTTATTQPLYPPQQQQQQFPPQQQQPNIILPSQQQISNAVSSIINTARHGSFLTNNNNNTVVGGGSGGQLQHNLQSQSFVLPKTTTALDQQQQPSLARHHGSFIHNYPPQQQQPLLVQGNTSQMLYPQQQFSPQQQQQLNVSSTTTTTSPITGSISPSSFNSSSNQLLQQSSIANNNNSSFNGSGSNLMSGSQGSFSQSQMNLNSQQQHVVVDTTTTTTTNTNSQNVRKALPTLPVKSGSATTPQHMTGQSSLPVSQHQPTNVVQWTGVVTDQYIDYVVSQLPIPVSIQEHYERYVRPCKI